MESESSDHPSWLDKEFVQTVIQNKEKNTDIVVTELNVRPAVGKGDNFGSVLLRLNVNVQNGVSAERRHFVVKSFPTIEMIQKMLEHCGTFEREIHMYQVTLPAMNKILAKDGLPPLCATSYSTTRPRTIFMHDLTSEGFKMADRRIGLDLAQATLALRMLARFHASALILRKRDPSSMDTYVENYYCEENREILSALMEPLLQELFSQVKHWPGYEHFADKLIKTLAINNVITFFKSKKNETIVLNHGDVWINNLLFKSSPSGDVTDMRFVDFQEMRIVSPVIDLQYFLHTSLSDVVREHHWDQLFEVYHIQFVDALSMQGEGKEDIPKDLATVNALKEKFNEKNFFGLWAAATIFPVVVADSSEAPEFGNYEESDGHVTMFKTSRFTTVFKKLLHRFENMGVFELDFSK